MQRDNRHILDANIPGPVALLRDALRSSMGRGGKMEAAHSLLAVQPMIPGRRHMSTQNTHDSPKQWTAFPGSIFNLQNKKPFSVGDLRTIQTPSLHWSTDHSPHTQTRSNRPLVTTWPMAFPTTRSRWALSHQCLQNQDTAAPVCVSTSGNCLRVLLPRVATVPASSRCIKQPCISARYEESGE